MITSLTINDDRVIAEALRFWERETNLNFVRSSSGKVHIEIRFERGRHGDEDDFDGRGGTLVGFIIIYKLTCIHTGITIPGPRFFSNLWWRRSL